MIGVALVRLGWGARKVGALIKKSRETEVIRAAEPNAAAKDAGDQFGFHSPRTWRRRWTIRRSTRSFSRPHTASMASMVRQSVAARKHVFCERPLAHTRKEAVPAVDLCKSASLVLGMGHERRFEHTIAGKTVYPITGDQLVRNISLLELIVQSTSSGRVESVA
jgi:Oxidoreductase family, NAD-binding Rossmann fold